jgi:hypothetical protein
MVSNLAKIIHDSAIDTMANKEGHAYTLGFLNSVLGRVLDDATMNKVNDELIKGIESL